MSESRNERLASDYRGMQAIQDQPYLSWIVTGGDQPYAEEYLLNISVRSYVFRMKEGVCTVGAIRRCTVKVTLRPSYPSVAPYVRMLDIPPVFHPAWYSKGTYCPPVPWRPETSLKEFVKEMIGTLCYDPDLIDEASPANYKALDWYQKNRGNAAFFPSDTIRLTESVLSEESGDPTPYEEVVDRWSVR